MPEAAMPIMYVLIFLTCIVTIIGTLSLFLNRNEDKEAAWTFIALSFIFLGLSWAFWMVWIAGGLSDSPTQKADPELVRAFLTLL